MAEPKPMKGFRDFNQLQAEMKQREKELKKKLKKAKSAEKSTASSNATNNNEEGEEDSSEGENDLPEQYIEEIVTERQFIDSDGQVKLEVTTTEVNS